jgi:predicted thioredoxin/glutaredoxin
LFDKNLIRKISRFEFIFLCSCDTSSSLKVPLITLYTHDHCSLCDDLVEELEVNFHGRYQLEKVDITNKENLKFLRLYRLEIPVVFLNGQFLCKNRLNIDLLERKLREFEANL